MLNAIPTDKGMATITLKNGIIIIPPGKSPNGITRRPVITIAAQKGKRITSGHNDPQIGNESIPMNGEDINHVEPRITETFRGDIFL